MRADRRLNHGIEFFRGMLLTRAKPGNVKTVLKQAELRGLGAGLGYNGRTGTHTSHLKLPVSASMNSPR